MFLNRIILLVCTMTGLAASAATPIEFDPIKARPLSRIPAENSRANSPKLLTADGQQLYANLWYKGAWDSQAPSYGIYSFPMVEGNPAGFDAVVKDPRLCGNAGAVYANGKYFVATSEEVNAPNGGYVVMSMKFYLFDTLTWKATEIPNADEEFKAMDMAYDPMTDKVYGCFVKRGVNGYYYFGTLDINTGHVTMIRNYGQDSAYAFTGVAVSGSGTVYAINAAGSLYSLDKTTGVASLIGETGLPNQYMTSATIDPVSGKIYYVLNSDLMTGMYEINPVNAVAKRLYSFQDQESVAGMYLPEAAPDPNAPAATTDLTATFTDGSLSGKVAFTAPVLTYGGSALSGSLTYTLKANGNTVTTGTAKAGSYVERELTVKGAGEYSFSVTFSNAKGDGATARAGLYIGPDMPLPPTDVVLTLASDGSMSLSWTPSVSAHGGWLDPAALKYVVTRLDGSQAGETAATQFSEPVPDPSTRTRNVYSVAARSGSFTSEATGSNTVFAGSYPTPHIETFDSRDALEDYLVDDGDGDGKCWLWQDGQLHSSICLERQVDDLVMLPPVTLERGMSYRVSIRAKATRSPLKVYPERIAVWAGYARSRQDMNIGVIAPTDVTTDQYATLSGLFTPSQSGP